MVGDFLTLAAIALLGLLIGGPIWLAVALRKPLGMEWVALVMPMGLGVAGLIIGVFAAFGWFQVGLILVLIATFPGLIAIYKNPGHRFTKSTYSEIKNRYGALQFYVFIFMVSIAWIGLQSPVTDGDALCYHLEVAKRMAMTGKIQFDPDLHETAYPLLVESLQAAVLKMRGPVATRAISFWFGISLAFSSALLAEPLVGKKRSTYAALFILSSPIVNCGMIAPLNDVPLASLCASALTSWIVLEQSGVSLTRRSMISGIFCGLACGIKFPAIVWSSVMGLFILMQFAKTPKNMIQKKDRYLLAAYVFTLSLIATGGFWYVRSAALTGNPVHPYFRNTFGGNGLDEVLEDARKSSSEHVWNILTAPLGLALLPSRYDSFSHQIGPLFLALIPLGLLRRNQALWYCYFAIGWLEMALCLTQRQSPRFYIAALAPWSACACKGLSDFLDFVKSPTGKTRLNKIAAFSLVSMVMAITAFNIARVRHGALMLIGLESPSQWLIQNEPTSALAEWVDLNLPENARLIGQDHRGFYWPRPFTMEKAHRRRTGILHKKLAEAQVVDHLAKQGFTHLVMAEPDPIDAVEFDPDLSNYLENWLSSHKPILDRVLHEPDGYNRRYRIYVLENANPSANASISKPEREAQP